MIRSRDLQSGYFSAQALANPIDHGPKYTFQLTLDPVQQNKMLVVARPKQQIIGPTSPYPSTTLFVPIPIPLALPLPYPTLSHTLPYLRYHYPYFTFSVPTPHP